MSEELEALREARKTLNRLLEEYNIELQDYEINYIEEIENV